MEEQVIKIGDFSLKILKKVGYKIHVYTSARFNYYHMDKSLFWENRILVAGFHEFGHDGTLQTYESDRQCIKKLQEDMELYRNEEGHLFLIFFNSTHFDYSWPQKDRSNFEPVDDGIDYLKIVFSQTNLKGIKNRYKHAIFYLDTLFKWFYDKLNSIQTGHEAITIVTGDDEPIHFDLPHIEQDV